MSRHPAGGRQGGGGYSPRGAGPGQPVSRARFPGLQRPAPDSPTPAGAPSAPVGPRDGTRTPPQPQRCPEPPAPAQSPSSPPPRCPRTRTGSPDSRRARRYRGSPASSRFRLAPKSRKGSWSVASRSWQKKMSQSGEVQEVGKGTGSGALCLPHSKENKVAGSTSPASKEEKGLDPFRQTGASPGAKGRTRASSAKRQGGRPAKGKPGEGRGKRQGRKS